ncbi:MAG: DUF3084 domain-containing protein [Firmicutes bacterium]|nr:DUF3084 domain-containing protein [Bacillota bacterium]
MYGIRLVLALIIVGGIIAFIGDKIGMKVGRKRLTLFGLRPRHTSIIVTILTGAFIAGATIGVLSIVSEDVRTALFNMKELKEALADSKMQIRLKDVELEQKKELARRLELEIAQKTVDFENLKQEYQGVLAEKEKVQSALDSVYKELERVEAEHQAALAKVSETQKALEFEQQRVERLKELSKPLAEAVERLKTEVASLNEEKKRLTEEITNLQTDLYFGNVAYRADEIVLSTVIEGNRDAAVIKNELLDFLNGPANEEALKRGASIEGKDKALQVIPEHLDQAAEIISNTKGKVVVRVVSYANALVGNPVPVYFKLFKNQRIFTKDEVIAQAKVDSFRSADQLLMDILNLLGEVNEKAIEAGMVTTPEGTVGQTVNWTDVPKTIDKIKSYSGLVTVAAVAARDTYSAEGPLQIRLEVAPVE